jgi:hypothetical protein
MNQNLILLIILFVLFAITFTNEKIIKSYDISKIGKNVSNIFESKSISEPCILYENTNRTQCIYMKLVSALKNLSNINQIKLGPQCKEEIFIQGTSTSRLREEVNQITKIILDRLNKQIQSNFQSVYLDTITIYEDENGDKNFIYNVFVNDPNEELDIRLFIDVIKYVVKCPKIEKPITCTSLTTPGMSASGVENTFVIGYPQPEQLIPLPTEVITTGGGPDLLSVKGINIHKIPPIRSIYINTVKIFNTNAVINSNNQCTTQCTPACGNIDDTTLSSSAFNQITTPFVEPAHIRNRWPIISPIQTEMKAFPCGKASEYWNEKGVPISVSCNTQEAGINGATTDYPIEASFWRSNFALPKWSGPNSWLFSLTRGSPNFGADFTD